MASTAGAVATGGMVVDSAEAGLVMFPANVLNNSYILLRAGESAADAAGIGYSNPVNKQSQYAELTTLGKRQVINRLAPALSPILESGSAWLWPSIHSSSYQTAEILAAVSGLGRSRLVPEYSYLVPRGLGALDCYPLDVISPVLQEGDASSALWKPPRGYDGTPNESVQDVMIRVRQVLSIVETQYDEEVIVFIAPDSTVLSVLQAAILGIDLRQHWGLEYRPAEMRYLELQADAKPNMSSVSFKCDRPPLCL